MEIHMNALINARTLLAAAGTATLLALALSSNANASTQRLSFGNCTGSTAAKVIRCCDQLVRKQGMPDWMTEYGNCNKAIACKSYIGGKNYCFVKIFPPNIDKNKGPKDVAQENPNTKPF